MLFIGDVHGKFKRYKRLIAGRTHSIQVGDMGVGFRRPDGRRHPNPPRGLMIAGGHRFIRGNHDHPGECHAHPQYISDGHSEGDMMLIGGAWSDDSDWRIEGQNWWPDEEVSADTFDALAQSYGAKRPRIMVTHDCPADIAIRMYALCNMEMPPPSRTQTALQGMFTQHQPDLWLFGHYHVSADFIAEGTRFVCLAELEAREFDV